ncbi:NAD(P)H-dependent glycerol-3-phosphate dehydrogenase [Emticicia sp. BO119]|uniref:NAD(P)H-dependent glycerol-3-phosphate dehydrogenase n=1 Tax=Emticicia sp. BO119 TaxID=2757768 RepID=UPI0015F0C9C1|nr:NAD(P)H-dependent glycerol-3-phosphate dehydrogenase [Emticicia sp. BO119]MBA4852948.1 NAD(P)H-dependent glycerol-3-phosphate dehydrogenase [Emticicia sp. BO119]
MKITIIGGGSWATAIIKILSEGNVQIKWWMRNSEDAEYIKKLHHNRNYLSSVEIHPSKVRPYTNLKEALRDTEWVVLAVPAAFLADALTTINKNHLQDKKIISAIKGMIPATNQLVTDWIEQTYDVPADNIGVIAGPCHAEEVALEKHSYLTIASPNLILANDFADLLRCRFVSTSALDDLYGVEYAAVIKNIVALACGITHGLGGGDNFQAVMVSNAMQEICRVVDVIDPMKRDLSASAYLGDLLVTAYSQFSRNRTFGNMVGRGYSVKAAQLEMNMIAEGYYAVKCIYEMLKGYDIDMPITNFAYQILYQNAPLKKEFEYLKEKLK